MAVLYTALLEAFTYACGIMHSVHASMPIEHLHHSLSVLANEPSLYIRHGRFSVQYSLKPLFIILHIVESLLANSNLRLILKETRPPPPLSSRLQPDLHAIGFTQKELAEFHLRHSTLAPRSPARQL